VSSQWPSHYLLRHHIPDPNRFVRDPEARRLPSGENATDATEPFVSLQWPSHHLLRLHIPDPNRPVIAIPRPGACRQDENATDVTQPCVSSQWPSHHLLRHHIPDPNRLVPDPEATCLPSGENATDVTRLGGPRNGPPTTSLRHHIPDPHRFVLPSRDYMLAVRQKRNRHDTTCLSSQLLPTITCVSASQILTVLSAEPEAMRLPSGENATHVTHLV
jgi:hypothetical protein